MLHDLPPWMGNIHESFPHWYCGVIVTVVAVLCGAIVGMERGKRQKPAGLRTMMLICLGSSVFTQAGLLLAGSQSDPGRVAAQVVTGVGFLGAGAIMRSGGLVIGFTTAAAIWVVAAIGVAVGSGYVVAGAFFTFVAWLTLTAERPIESFIYGGCRWTHVRIEFDDDHGKTRLLLQDILDDHQVDDDQIRFEPSRDGAAFVTIRYCHRHRQHRAFIADLVKLPAVRRVSETKG